MYYICVCVQLVFVYVCVCVLESGVKSMFKISACDVPLAVVIACHCGNEFQILEIRNRWTKNAGNRKTQNGYRKTEKMLKILQFHFKILPHTYIHISVRFRIRFYKVSSDKNGPSLLQHVVIVPDPPFSV